MTGRDGTLSVWSRCPSEANSQFLGRVRPSQSVLDYRFAKRKSTWSTVISHDSRPTYAVCQLLDSLEEVRYLIVGKIWCCGGDVDGLLGKPSLRISSASLYFPD